jgi:hypothetical protein
MNVKTKYLLSLLSVLSINVGFTTDENFQINSIVNDKLSIKDPIKITNNKGETSDVGFVVDVHGVISSGVLQPFKSYSHSLEDFDNISLIAENPPSNLRPRAYSWNNDMTKLYGISRTDDEIYLMTTDTTTGISTQLSRFSGYASDEQLQGITLDDQNNCYVITTDNVNHDTKSTLYSCNLFTGQLTKIGSQTTAPDLHDILATCDGTLYGMNTASETLYTINKQNGAVSIVGNTGIDAEYASLNMAYDRQKNELYHYVIYSTGYHTALAKLDVDTGLSTYVSEAFIYGRHVGEIKSSCSQQQESFDLNPGFNGAWYNPNTGGQGILIDVLPQSDTFFAAWFTFAETTEDEGIAAAIGSTDQRWLTAQGSLGQGNVIDLTIYNTHGGTFNQSGGVESEVVGEMTISFDDCSNGFVEFTMNDSGLSDSIVITRLANDNVVLCESLIEASK